MRRIVSVLAAAVFLAVAVVPSAGATEAATSYMWQNDESDQCMSAEGGRMVNGTKVIQWPCNSASLDQHWYLDGGQIRNAKDSSFCLSAPNNWTSSGLQLIIWRCQGASGQLWLRHWDGLYVVIQNANSGKVVAVSGSSHTNGAPVIQWDVTGNPDQLWWASAWA